MGSDWLATTVKPGTQLTWELWDKHHLWTQGNFLTRKYTAVIICLLFSVLKTVLYPIPKENNSPAAHRNIPFDDRKSWHWNFIGSDVNILIFVIAHFRKKNSQGKHTSTQTTFQLGGTSSAHMTGLKPFLLFEPHVVQSLPAVNSCSSAWAGGHLRARAKCGLWGRSSSLPRKQYGSARLLLLHS